MFLNYRRTSLTYILLSVFTLGFYSARFRADIARDYNTACGERLAKVPSAKFVILNILTFGVYATLWDMEFLKLCQKYSEENGKEFTTDLENYKFFGVIPILRFWVLPNLIYEINQVCRIYSDKQLEDVDTSDLFSVNRVKDTDQSVDDIYTSSAPVRELDLDFTEQARETKSRADADGGNAKIIEQSERKIAGHAVVEEYDPEKDQRRIGYQIRFRRQDENAEKEADEKRRAEEAARAAAEEAEREKQRKILDALNCYRSKRWLTKTVALLFAVFILPFIMIAVTVFALPSVYDETYMGALSEKYELLNETKGKKIVIIGGSSTALGIDSDIIDDEINGYKVVNFGLSSELGIKAMLDLSRGAIGEDDIIIIAPEMSDIGMSLHFNGEAMLRALDGNLGLLMNIESEDYGSLIGSSLDFTCNKLGYLISGTKPENARSAYLQDNIDKKTGDNVYSRPYNEALGVYNSVNFSYRANLKDSEVTEYERFIEYVNEYTHFADRKGATVYYSFAPICSEAIADGVTSEDINLYYSNLCGVLQCKVISDIKNYIFDEEYFYDSEITLSDAGVSLRTIKLVDDLKLQMKNSGATLATEELALGFVSIPTVAQTEAEKAKDAENAKYFVFEPFVLDSCGSRAEYYSVVGVTDEGAEAQSLTVPAMYNGKPVIRIAQYAFKDAKNLTALYLGQSIAIIERLAFADSTVTAVYIPDGKSPADIRVPVTGKALLEGASPLLAFYVEKDKLELYKNDLGYWEYYRDIIKEKSN